MATWRKARLAGKWTAGYEYLDLLARDTETGSGDSHGSSLSIPRGLVARAITRRGFLMGAVGHQDRAIVFVLGAAFLARSKFTDAEACLLRAMEIGARNPQVLANLGDVLRIQGKFAQAIETYRKARKLDRASVALMAKLALAQEVILESRESALARRAEVTEALQQLLARKARLTDPQAEVGMTNFYFAYQGINDVELQSLTAKFYLGACPEAGVGRAALLGAGHRIEAAAAYRLRVHQLVRTHDWKVLPRHHPEVFARAVRGGRVRPPQDADALGDAIARAADRNVEIPYDLYRAREIIAAERLDIIFYPDIGMTPLTYFLAFARLAPVQCVSWGHPVTTGIPAIDYFISARSIEPPDAQLHYSERLILLDRLPTYYRRPHHDGDRVQPRRNGLSRRRARSTWARKVCSSCIRISTWSLATLLRRDPKARLLLLSGVHKHWDRLLAGRIARAFPTWSTASSSCRAFRRRNFFAF